MSFRPSLVLGLVALAACDREQPAGPERHADGVFAYAAPMTAGQTLTLRNMVGALRIEPAADDTLRVVADLTWRGDSTPPREIAFRGESIANGVLVCAVFGEGRCSADDYQGKSESVGFSIGSKGINLGLGGPSQASVTFRVQVPAGVRLDLAMIDGEVVSASSAPVKARGVDGTMTIVTSVGPVQAKTVNGDIDARMTTLAGNDSVLVETVNGSVSAYLPQDAAATVEVKVTNGSALSDFAGIVGGSERMNKSLTGVLGAGTTPVYVRALNGNATLRRLDADGRPFALP